MSPRLPYPQETNSLASAYNGAVSTPQQVRAGMKDIWKQWEGRVVDGEFPLQRYLRGSDHSAVFLTQHGEGTAQRAVIKLVPADLREAEAQLLRWRVATKLPAPGLIRIFEVGQAKLDNTELLYVVMECPDEDLAQILPERPLTPAETRDMLSQVLDTLAYVHSKGFIHGRVEPSNIMAVADRIKLSSDCLCALQDETGREREGSRYTAPEVARGAISPASDVWSLGMTLVETLTQHLPVPDPVRTGAVVPPDGMPEPFLGIASRCLQVDPQQRSTIADIAARLKPVLSVPRATESHAPTPLQKQFSAKWLYLMAIAAVGLVFLVWVSNGKTKTPHPPDDPARAGANQGQSASPSQPSQAPTISTAAAQSIAAAPSGTAPKAAGSADLNGTAATGPTPGVVHSVIPDVSRSARNTIDGKVRVRVRVQVDASGNVVSAKLDSRGPSKYFAHLALEAAQGWKFVAARAQGQDVVREWTLDFAFSRSGTEVVPKQISP